ncbi:MAG: acyl-CoA dehydrogenase family protein [Burkholderiales bacterium]
MSYIETAAQRELQEAARAVVHEVIEPAVTRLGPAARMPADELTRFYKALAPLGYVGSTLPVSVGGPGLTYVDFGLLIEALGCSPVALDEVVPPRTIYYLGNDAQRARWLPSLLSGNRVSAAAITEPQAGSDMRAFTCKAELRGDHYLVNGRKRWIKLGATSDLMTLMVVDDSGGLSRLVVERAESAWHSVPIDTVGMRTIDITELVFENVRVPRENLLGSSGQGAEQFHRGIESSRALIGIQACGIARHALDIAISYAKERKAFGKPIGKFQAIQTALAIAETRLQAARLLCLSALARLDAGQRAPKEVSMAKSFAVEAAVSACLAAMESMGAWGLATDAGVERCWRDCAMLTAIDGTANIQRLIVGRELLGMAAFS